MNRITDAWLEFDGVKNTAKHLRLMAMPRRPLPSERGKTITVPGRSGYLFIGENGARESVDINAEMTTTDGFSMDELTAWLFGKTAWLRFGDDPNRAYQARVMDEFFTEPRFLSFDAKTLTIPFNCQPYRYIFPQEAATVLTGAGSVRNTGTAKSAPRIKIEGSGTMTVAVSGVAFSVSGGGVIIDSELMECFNLDGVTLANSRVTMDDFPMLTPGNNAVSWTGSVTRVTITPRSRCL